MRSIFFSLGIAAAAGGSISPAVKNPLRDELAKAETAAVEEAVRTCLAKTEWKVDPVGSYSGGANVVTAYKATEPNNVYVYPADVKPRVTGGPDYVDPFWTCLTGELGHKAESEAAPPGDGGR